MSYYKEFKDAFDKYLPDCGEGDNKATQITTAVYKLMYGWYNNGDIFDTTQGLMGWENDISSYANWLAKYVDAKELYEVKHFQTQREYIDLLWKVARKYLDLDLLARYENDPAIGTIYECEGDFVFEEFVID